MHPTADNYRFIPDFALACMSQVRLPAALKRLRRKQEAARAQDYKL
jgi:hypothetical protein